MKIKLRTILLLIAGMYVLFTFGPVIFGDEKPPKWTQDILPDSTTFEGAGEWLETQNRKAKMKVKTSKAQDVYDLSEVLAQGIWYQENGYHNGDAPQRWIDARYNEANVYPGDTIQIPNSVYHVAVLKEIIPKYGGDKTIIDVQYNLFTIAKNGRDTVNIAYNWDSQSFSADGLSRGPALQAWQNNQLWLVVSTDSFYTQISKDGYQLRMLTPKTK